MLLLATLALARPTEGGSWAFDDTDTIVTYDSEEGLVRVWYSVEGNNAVDLDDADGSGVPDFVEAVAASSESVLLVYETAGFRLPLSDEGKGGSDALDAYLVDFGGDADGMWASECGGSNGACSGYFTMENDFAGYGYGDLDEAVRVLTSHELFHGVQAAYAQSEAVWFLEGTATWAEHLYDPYNDDFLRLCSYYLDDAGRSLSEPPAGPVPAFAYATALWWFHLAERHGEGVMVEMLEAFADHPEDDELLVAMTEIEAARGSTLWDDFSAFSMRNLATGDRAGAYSDEYPFAAELREVKDEEDGSSFNVEDRVYPLATVYYELDWAGGDLYFATAEAAPDLFVSIHPLDSEGRVLDADYFPEPAAAAQSTPADAGTYWIVVSNPTLADDSTKVPICIGTAADVEPCLPEAADTDEAADGGEDTGGTGGGCGCHGASTLPLATSVLLGFAIVTRRRRGLG
ncbi:MAG: hypothetical protein FJ090_20865 [Deltaproteobacteria bacterium]|nr:hypothetical protein [Deltaproteobacteria bacterium]